jgi:hypothetical protein
MSRLTVVAACVAALSVALVAHAADQTPASASQGGNVIRACVKKRGGQMRMLLAGSRCSPSERLVSWNTKGPAGTPGTPGQVGATGARGEKGDPGIPGPIAGTPAGGALAGTFPNPTIANGAVDAAAVAATLMDGSAATPTLRSLGSGPLQAAAGNDPRLSDQRTPLDNSVTGAKVANGTLHIADLFPIKQTTTLDVPSIPASSCTGFTIASAGTNPGDIAFGFAPLNLSDELVLPPSMFGTAGETPLKICNIGATALDPPSMTYTVYIITG